MSRVRVHMWQDEYKRIFVTGAGTFEVGSGETGILIVSKRGLPAALLAALDQLTKDPNDER